MSKNVFLQGVSRFQVFKVFNPILVSFCRWCENNPVACFACSRPGFSIPFIEEVPSSLYCCLLCHRLTGHKVWVYFWALYFVPLINVYFFALVPYCFCSCNSFAMKFESMVSSRFVLSQELFWVFKVFCVYMQDLELLVLILWKCHWYFDRNCAESMNYLGWYSHFNNFNSSNQQVQYIFPLDCATLTFFHQCPTVFWVQVFLLMPSKYFIIFDAIKRSCFLNFSFWKFVVFA